MTEQTKAERLADALDRWHHGEIVGQAAAELRRLSTVNATLLDALNIIAGNRPCVDNLMGDADIARAAIKKAEEGLLRLSVVNAELLEALKKAADHAYWPDIEKQIRAAIARATEEGT